MKQIQYLRDWIEILNLSRIKLDYYNFLRTKLVIYSFFGLKALQQLRMLATAKLVGNMRIISVGKSKLWLTSYRIFSVGKWPVTKSFLTGFLLINKSYWNFLTDFLSETFTPSLSPTCHMYSLWLDMFSVELLFMCVWLHVTR